MSEDAPSAKAAHSDNALAETPLAALHREAGARMVPFAGYTMPLQYEGIVAEHRATRERAGLFDVSHMGQIDIGAGEPDAAAAWLERLVPSDLRSLQEGRARYSVLTTESGGVLDDIIATRLADRFRLVVNGARRAAVAQHLQDHADPTVPVDWLDRALIALQGPAAEAVLEEALGLSVSGIAYMAAAPMAIDGTPALVSRCGYTGEDGFELSVPASAAERLWGTLGADPRVQRVGLGARDTLRLEAGLCLYGQDLSEDISLVEAGLNFIVGKRRRAEGGFLGDARILKELADGPARKRVGLAVDGRVPVRSGAALACNGDAVGSVTSGGVSPTLGRPIAMGFVEAQAAQEGTALSATVRGREVPLTVAALPFVEPRTKRKAKA